MNRQQFAQDLQNLKERVLAWGRSPDGPAPAAGLTEAGEELHVALDELQTAEEELRRQNQALEVARDAAEAERRRYQDLFDSAPDAYLVTDLEGVVREANRAAARLFGTPERFLAGKPLVLLVAPDDRRAFHAELTRRLGETCRADEMLLRMQPRGGAPFPAALTVAATADGRGRPAGLRWLVRDVSRRPVEEGGAAAEPGLWTRLAELTDADRHKDEFLAVLAHELRNPLAPLSVALQMLRRCRADAAGATAVQALDTAERQVQKLSRLVDELLDVSRIRQGKTELRRERVDLAAVAAAAVETVRPLIDERRHALEVSLPAEPVCLEADPGRLEQVLTNLLTNAAKYTEPGGRITLRAEPDGAQVLIRVRDTGVGISPELLPRLFEPFVQSAANAGRSRGGLGLGLALVKRFVELHGGSVEAHSDGPGRGSEFVVRLPAAQPPAAGEGKEENGAPSGRSVSVLIVDDNRDAAASLAQLVGLWGCRATTACDAASALAAARKEPPDMVLMDIGLPDMDGCEALRRLREETGQAPVAVALTGFSGEGECARMRAAGFERCLVKPPDLKELQGLLVRR
jgi:PAS domain S-box-containing protein